ncbi:unnamed protein product, partial [Allacma fusca]
HDLQIWHQRGVRVFVWTVNNPLEKLFFSDIGVGYLTDTLHGNFSLSKYLVVSKYNFANEEIP